MITFDLKTLPGWETLVTGKYILQMVSIADNHIDSNKSEPIEFAHIDLSPYNVLSYLVANRSSKAWIDLGIPYQNGCRAEYKITFKGSANIFGVFYNGKRCRGFFNANDIVFNIGTASSNTVYPTVSGLTGGAVYTITCQANPDIPNAAIVVDDRQQVLTVKTDWLTWDSSPHNMYLFAINSADIDTRAHGIRVIHYFKYWNVDNNLILDLIPVERKSDGALGMLNKVNGQFLTNASTGTFYKEVPANADYVEDDTDIII